MHTDYQGYGIGSLLVRWGLDRVADEGLPVFATGETRGTDFYEKVMGFQRVQGSEYWLDKGVGDIQKGDIEGGNQGWKKENGELSGAEMVWCPKGVNVVIRGQV